MQYFGKRTEKQKNAKTKEQESQVKMHNPECYSNIQGCSLLLTDFLLFERLLTETSTARHDNPRPKTLSKFPAIFTFPKVGYF